jgi:hypothetical protein
MLLPNFILPEKLPVSGLVKKLLLFIEPGELPPCAQCDWSYRVVLWIYLFIVMPEIFTQQKQLLFLSLRTCKLTTQLISTISRFAHPPSIT